MNGKEWNEKSRNVFFFSRRPRRCYFCVIFPKQIKLCTAYGRRARLVTTIERWRAREKYQLLKNRNTQGICIERFWMGNRCGNYFSTIAKWIKDIFPYMSNVKCLATGEDWENRRIFFWLKTITNSIWVFSCVRGDDTTTSEKIYILPTWKNLRSHTRRTSKIHEWPSCCILFRFYLRVFVFFQFAEFAVLGIQCMEHSVSQPLRYSAALKNTTNCGQLTMHLYNAVSPYHRSHFICVLDWETLTMWAIRSENLRPPRFSNHCEKFVGIRMEINWASLMDRSQTIWHVTPFSNGHFHVGCNVCNLIDEIHWSQYIWHLYHFI